MNKCISPALTPTFEKDDILLSLKTLFSPQKYFQTKAIGSVNSWFSHQYPDYHLILAESGRSLLEIYLKNLKLQTKDEVLLQALTCSVVPAAIIKAGLKPVFVDVTDTFNMDTINLTKKITQKSKVLIIQHSFGRPDDIKTIKQICQKHNLILIEDCAHALGVNYHGKPLGSFGHAAFFSFGRDKVISSVWGGALLVKDKQTYQNILDNTNFHHRNFFWVSKQLLYPSIIYLVTTLYGLAGLGKLIHFIAQKTGLITKAVSKADKTLTETPIYSLPNQLAVLTNHQLNKLDHLLTNRRQLAKSYAQIFNQTYHQDHGYLRYALTYKNKQKLINLLKPSNIILGDWYYQPVIPNINLSKFGYTKGSCPTAEKISQLVINLPTNPNLGKTDVNKLLLKINNAINQIHR